MTNGIQQSDRTEWRRPSGCWICVLRVRGNIFYEQQERIELSLIDGVDGGERECCKYNRATVQYVWRTITETDGECSCVCISQFTIVKMLSFVSFCAIEHNRLTGLTACTTLNGVSVAVRVSVWVWVWVLCASVPTIIERESVVCNFIIAWTVAAIASVRDESELSSIFFSVFGPFLLVYSRTFVTFNSEIDHNSPTVQHILSSCPWQNRKIRKKTKPVLTVLIELIRWSGTTYCAMTGVYFVGVDVGTGSARAALVDAHGRVKHMHVKTIETWNPLVDHYEQSSDDIWSAVCECVRVSFALFFCRLFNICCVIYHFCIWIVFNRKW